MESLQRGYSQVYDVEDTNRNLSGRNSGNRLGEARKSGSPIGTSPVTSLLMDTSNVNSTEAYPDALFLTHAHDDHIKELPQLIKHFDSSRPLFLYCTKSCFELLKKKFPELFKADSLNVTTNSVKSDNKYVLNLIEPDTIYEITPFSVVPVLAFHRSDSEGSVIYVIKSSHEGHERKVVIGWDFLELYALDKNILWNPNLLILGTQSYNPHPERGMISVSDAFGLIKEWNVRECYIVHYRGLLDTKQYHRTMVLGSRRRLLMSIVLETVSL